jgi:uncharacterized protein YifE (UPF0438 family)
MTYYEEARRRLEQAKVADMNTWEEYYRRVQRSPVQGVTDAWRTWIKAASQLRKAQTGVYMLEGRDL